MTDPGPSGPQPKKTKTRHDALKTHKVSPKWTEIVGDGMLHKFPGTKLPNNRTVMLRFHTLTCNSSYETSHYQQTQTIFSELKEIWDRSYIPMVSEKACIARIKRLLDSWKLKNCRLMKTGSTKQIAYTSMLNELCDLAPPADELLQQLKSTRLSTWQDDYQFYLNMKKYPQVGCMGTLDTARLKTLQKTQKRHEEEQ